MVYNENILPQSIKTVLKALKENPDPTLTLYLPRILCYELVNNAQSCTKKTQGSTNYVCYLRKKK